MEQTTGIFTGLKILELGSGAAGPVATRYFADQGARVIRIESAKRPDFLRLLHFRPNEPHNLEAAPMFVLLNPNKESLTLNLSKPEGVELLRKLISWTDVVAENFSPGVMKKWGLEYEDLKAINPGIVKVRTKLKSQMGRLLLANSITLTPGTLTLELDGEWLYIHLVTTESTDLEAATKSIVAGFERYLEVMYG